MTARKTLCTLLVIGALTAGCDSETSTSSPEPDTPPADIPLPTVKQPPGATPATNGRRSVTPPPALPEQISATVLSRSGSAAIGPSMARVSADVGMKIPLGGRLQLFKKNAAIEIEFTRGGRVSAEGAAEMLLIPVDDGPRTVLIYEGRWRFKDIGKTPLRAVTPFGIEVTLREAGADVVVNSMTGVTVRRTAGDFVVVTTGDTSTRLGDDEWTGHSAGAAWFESTRGDVRVSRAGKPVPLTAATILRQGDRIVTNGAETQAVIVFPDRSSTTLGGESQLVLPWLTPTGRRIRLAQGTLTKIYVRGVALEVQTATTASLVLQNASAVARMHDGGVEFSDVSGDFARVYDDGESHEVKGRWSSKKK